MNIQDDIAVVVASMRTAEGGPPYFMYGHRNEIAARLLKKEGSSTNKNKKYPLIILAMDIPEPQRRDVIEFSLNLAIVCRTKDEYNVEQRMVEKFKPILYPLRDQFKQAIVDSGLFMWPGDPTVPECTPIDRPKWGVWAEEGTLKQYMPDPLDCIEILDLKLNQVNC